MSKTIDNLIRTHERGYFTDAELDVLLNGTSNSRYSKVKRLIAQGKLLHIRRGLYCIAERPEKCHPFEIAQLIYGPSYISYESALSFHQLIPEAVYTITSACIKRSKQFHTPLGVFNYLRLPEENFFTGVDLVVEQGHSFFMATPWKAICDYIYSYKKEWKNTTSLTESLRIDLDALPPIHSQEIELFDEYYHNKRMRRFFKNL